MSDKEFSLIEMAKEVKSASKIIAKCSSAKKNNILNAMASALENNTQMLISENKKDLEYARTKGISKSMMDRLTLNEKRVKEMADALREVASFNDPVGEISEMKIRPNGIRVGKMTIPLGVIGIIYEARPNVTSDAAGLCIKAGNAVILRGGSEAFNSNMAIVKILQKALEDEGLPKGCVTFVPSPERSIMTELLKLDEYIDLIIPRGGESLIRFVAENSRIPVIKHYKGVCHIFVDKTADEKIAMDLLADGKLSRPGVCNALETMLVHKDIAASFLPKAGKYLSENNVEIRGCSETLKFIPSAKIATEDDYAAEFLDLIIAVRVVNGFDEAVDHIQKYASDHTEVIVTNDYNSSQRFISEINSSVVLVNASSRFSDGGQLGLGAEIGISTTKLHAYGPMGIESLTTKKFVVFGEGQSRHGYDVKI